MNPKKGLYLLFWTLAVFAAWTGPWCQEAAGQAKVVFKTDKMLEGYEEAAFSDYRHLYDFEPFESLHGTLMTPEEVAEIKAAWETEKKRVQRTVAGIGSKSALGSLLEVERNLNRSSFFRERTLFCDSSLDPLIFYFQVEKEGDSLSAPPAVLEMVPLVKEMAARFKADYAGPLGFRPAQEPIVLAAVFLQSPREYERYLYSDTLDLWETQGGCFDPSLQAAVTYLERGEDGEWTLAHDGRGLLYGAAQNLLRAYRASGPEEQAPAWILDGLSERLIRGLEEEGAPSSASRPNLGKLLKNRGERAVYFADLNELLKAKSHAEYIQEMLLKTIDMEIKIPVDLKKGLAYFQQEAGWFVEFLQTGMDGRYFESFRQALRSAMTGTGSIAAGTPDFQREDPRKLFVEFVDFLNLALGEGPVLSDTDRDDFLSRMTALAPEREAARPKDLQSRLFPVSGILDYAFKPSRLAEVDLPPQALLGRALWTARLGEFEEALSMAQGLEEREIPGSRGLADRVESRLKALIELRDGFLETCGAEDRKIRIRHEGKEVLGVPSLEKGGGQIRMETRDGAVLLPKKAFDPDQLLQELRKKPGDAGEEWVQGFAALLTESRSFSKFSRGEGREAASLREDAETIESGLAEGEAALLLGTLSQAGFPLSNSGAQEILPVAKRLFECKNRFPWLKAMEHGLNQIALHALVRLFEEIDLGEAQLFKGKLEKLEQGRLRLNYEFNDPAELEDFTPEDYLASERERIGPIETPADAGSFEIRDGILACKGQGCLRIPFYLQAPFKIAYEIRYNSLGYEGVETLPRGNFFLGVCDDGEENCVRCIDVGNLFLFHGPAKVKTYALKEGYLTDVRYTVELEHDGKQIKTTLNGAQAQALRCGPFQEGGLFLWIHFDVLVEIDHLVMEGNPSDRLLSYIQEKYLLRELEAMKGK